MEVFSGQLDASSVVAFNRLDVIDSSLTIVDTSINTLQAEILDLSSSTLREDATCLATMSTPCIHSDLTI